jgi:WhiB family redox-sensing transcriptional regulator
MAVSENRSRYAASPMELEVWATMLGKPGTLDAVDVLLELVRPPAWHARAACRGVDTEVFFPTRGESTDTARAVCARCPVAGDCRTAGHHEHHGIWGGTSERERRRARRDLHTIAA